MPGGTNKPEPSATIAPSAVFTTVAILNSLVFSAGATLTGLVSLALSTFSVTNAVITSLIATNIGATSNRVATLYASLVDSVSGLFVDLTTTRLRVKNTYNAYTGPVIQSISSSAPYSGNIYQIGSTEAIAGSVDGNLFANPEPCGFSVSVPVVFGAASGFWYKWMDAIPLTRYDYGRLGIGTFSGGIFTAAYPGMYHVLALFSCANPLSTQFDARYVTSYLGSQTTYLGSVTRNNNLYNTQVTFVTYLPVGGTLRVEIYVNGAVASFGTLSRLDIWRI